MTSRRAIDKLKLMMGFKSQLYKSVFGTPDGQLVLADLVRETGWDQQSFVEGCADTTAFNEGMRRVVTRIVKFTQMTPGDIKAVVARYDAESENRGFSVYEGDEAA